VSVAFAACGGKSPTSPTAPDPSGVDAEQQSFSLSGHVLLQPSNQAIASAIVEIIEGANAGRRTTTDSEGRYQLNELRAGDMTVRASAESVGSKTTPIDLDANATVDFALAAEHPSGPTPAPTPPAPGPSARFALTGTVRADSSSQPIAGARIEIVSGAIAGQQATTDAGGRYRLADLPEGAATVKVTAAGFVAQTRSIAIGGDMNADFRLGAEGLLASGRVVNGLDNGGIGGIQIFGDGVTATTSAANGDFQLSVTSATNTCAVTFRGGGVVERQTFLTAPGSGITIDLMPASFNLGAFDEMVRRPLLRRWRAAPPLIIERRAVQYADVNMASGTAGGDLMSDAETEALLGDLRWALPQLTGETFAQFANVSRNLSNEGATVSLLNDGSITVVRVVGLADATGYWGFGRWRQDTDGTVTGGVVLLDRDFDRSSNVFKRSLRAHELGHALGYHHVTSADSVMNENGQREPTAFDRAATRFAFRRPPGNRSPDIDPAAMASPQQAGGGKWQAAIR
jgi:hypothetical protein